MADARKPTKRRSTKVPVHEPSKHAKAKPNPIKEKAPRKRYSRAESEPKRPREAVAITAPEVGAVELQRLGVDIKQVHATYIQALKSDLALFARDILGMDLAPHILEWSELINKHSRVSLNAARGHGKSAFFSYAYAIWRAWSEPGVEVYLFSATLDQAKEFLDIIIYGRDRLAGMVDIPALAHLVPSAEDISRDKRLRLNKEDVRFTNLSRIKCVGYGKKIRGRHPKYIVLDDVLNDEDMYSEMVRRKHIEYYKSAISGMVTPDGQIVAVGTPYHADDLYYGFLRKNSEYVFRRYPAILRKKTTGEERALFPSMWTLAKLQAKKKEIGTVAFTREFMVQPISDELAIFPSTLFEPLFDTTQTIRPSKATRKARGLYNSVFMGVDIARSAKVGADAFVIFVVAKDDEGNIYVLDIIIRKGLAFNDQLALIKSVSDFYKPQLVFVESVAMQQVWSDELRRTTDVPVKEFVTTAANKYPLDKGVPGLRILMENRKLIIPRGDAQSIALTDYWMAEMQQFGFIDGKLQGIGSHDDTVMAFWFAVEATKHGGFSFGTGDDGGVDEDAEDLEYDWREEMLGSADEDKDDDDDDDRPL